MTAVEFLTLVVKAFLGVLCAGVAFLGLSWICYYIEEKGDE